MNYLVDTHAALWFLSEDDALSHRARGIIESLKNIYISIASLWEISIKHSIHKLDIILPDINEFFENYIITTYSVLNIAPNHIKAVAKLPFIHRDPFDRMLVAQAKTENMTLITCDQFIPQYPVQMLW